eukprot:94370-Chlamydomonas_euryale.AAC.1
MGSKGTRSGGDGDGASLPLSRGAFSGASREDDRRGASFDADGMTSVDLERLSRGPDQRERGVELMPLMQNGGPHSAKAATAHAAAGQARFAASSGGGGGGGDGYLLAGAHGSSSGEQQCVQHHKSKGNGSGVGGERAVACMRVQAGGTQGGGKEVACRKGGHPRAIGSARPAALPPPPPAPRGARDARDVFSATVSVRGAAVAAASRACGRPSGRRGGRAQNCE